MSHMTLFEWMSEIDPRLIARADAPVTYKRKASMRAVVLIAAALVLVMLGTGVASAFMLDSYVEKKYEEYDGTILHALDISLTIDENVISTMLNEQTKASLRTLFNALRGIQSEPDESEKETDPVGSEGLAHKCRLPALRLAHSAE